MPVHLSRAEVDRYYEGFSNGVLWPLLPLPASSACRSHARDWGAYRPVNERFADVVAAHAAAG